MADLNGQYTVTFDPKSGRLAIPARHRKGMPEDQRSELYVTRGFEQCVTAYYKDSWAEFKDKITDRKLKKIQLNALKRQFIGRMNQVAFDKQGRISLNSDLIDYAGLQQESEVIIVGCEDYLEIWSPKLYQKYAEESEDEIQELYKKDYF